MLNWAIGGDALGVELTDPAASQPHKFDAGTTSLEVTPAEGDHVYTLVAVAGDVKSQPSTVHVSVAPAGHVYSPHAQVLPPTQAPQINSFLGSVKGGSDAPAASLSAASGATVVLKWEVAGDVASIAIDNGVGDVTGATGDSGDTSGCGSKEAAFSPASGATEVDYTLTVTPANSSNAPVSKVVKVTVSGSARSLVDLCADSLALDGPRPGCEGAKALHDRWLQFLDAAFPEGGVMAKDNRLAIETMNPSGTTHKTSCSQTLSNCFVNLGIPTKYFDNVGTNTIVPFVARKYVRQVTPDSLPRNGDPYIIGGPPGNPSETHHAVFGPITSKNPYKVLSYAGGQATYTNYQSIPDAKRYDSKLVLQDGKILIGERPLLFYTDMWAFFNDHASEVKDTGKMNLK